MKKDIKNTDHNEKANPVSKDYFDRLLKASLNTPPPKKKKKKE